MQKSDLEALLTYHYHAHRQVWDCIMNLTDEQFKQDLNYSVGSIYIQCVHTMATERFWLDNARNSLPPERNQTFSRPPYSTREEIRAAWDALEEETLAYLDSLSSTDLNADMEYDFSFSGKQRHPRWYAFLYIVTHAVDHRAQMLAGIHRMGGETVMQDFIRFVWGK